MMKAPHIVRSFFLAFKNFTNHAENDIKIYMTDYILYATDKNYLELCATSLYSLLEKASHPLSVYIIESDLGDEKSKLQEVAKKFNSDITFIPIADISSKLIAAGIPPYRGGYSPYARFFITDYITEGKILYLDCDILVKGDVTEILNFDADGKPIAAVADQCSSYVNPLIGLGKNDVYFNSGVLLFDAEKCHETNVSDRFLEAVKTIDLKNTFLGADQDIMNRAFYGQIGKLPLKSNMMFTSRFFSPKNIYRLASKNEDTYYTEDEIKDAKENPLAIHFAGGGRYQPWREEGIYFTNEEAREWFDAYKKCCPDGKTDTEKLEALHNTNSRRKVFFKIAKIMPGFYCSLKGFLRKVRLIPKLIKSR